MKKFIGILLTLYLLTFLFGADQVNWPDIYIDESVAPGGVGSLADPYSDFSEINWTTGGDNSIFDWYAGAEDASVTINLQEGEEWREQMTVGASGSATYPIIIQSYGSGADPIINGSDLVSTWTAYAPESDTFTANLDQDKDLNRWNFRMHYGPNDLSASGTEIRITVAAHSGTGDTLHGCSIVQRDADWNGTEVPTRITWNTGSASLTMVAGNTYISDWITFTLTHTNDYLIHFYTSTQKLYSRNNSGNDMTDGGHAYSAAEPDGTLTQNFTAEATDGLTSHYCSKIEVRTAQANTWQATLTTEPEQVFFDGTRGTEESSIGNLDTDQEWYWTANVLYQHSTSDPDARYTSPGTEASQRDYCIYGSSDDYITIDGITATKADLVCIRGQDCENWIIQNCTASYSFDLGILGNGTGDGNNENWLVDNNTVNYNGATGLAIVTAGNNWTVSNNTIHNNCQLDGSANQDYTGGIRLGVNTNVTNCTISGNTVYSNEDSGGVQQGVGIWLDTVGVGNVVKENLVYSNEYVGIKIERDESASLVCYNIVYDHTSTATADHGTGIQLVGYDPIPIDGARIYNNVCYANKIGISVLGSGDADMVLDNEIKNNISVDNTLYELKAINGGENDGINGSGNIYEYNCFGTEAANFILWGLGGGKATYDLWEVAYGDSTHSVELAPGFIDAVNEDFRLLMASPCINAGTDVGLTTDYRGRSIRHAPDIGAYEDPTNVLFMTKLFNYIMDKRRENERN